MVIFGIISLAMVFLSQVYLIAVVQHLLKREIPHRYTFVDQDYL